MPTNNEMMIRRVAKATMIVISGGKSESQDGSKISSPSQASRC